MAEVEEESLSAVEEVERQTGKAVGVVSGGVAVRSRPREEGERGVKDILRLSKTKPA
jgi:hypothetical protein